MLQEPGTGTRTGYVRVRREPKTPVLQVRRKRISCQRLSCLGSQVPPVRVARGSRQPQDGWGGMRPPPANQEETTRPRARGGGKNARQHRRRSRRWPGGGHGVGPMNSRGSSGVTWEGRDGRKTCSSRLSGRARSPSRWWLSRIASLTRPTGSGIWMDWQP